MLSSWFEVKSWNILRNWEQLFLSLLPLFFFGKPVFKARIKDHRASFHPDSSLLGCLSQKFCSWSQPLSPEPCAGADARRRLSVPLHVASIETVILEWKNKFQCQPGVSMDPGIPENKWNYLKTTINSTAWGNLPLGNNWSNQKKKSKISNPELFMHIGLIQNPPDCS